MEFLNSKNLKILGAVFIVLIIAATFPLWKEKLFPANESSISNDLKITSLTENGVEEFSIKKGEEVKRFRKDNGVWKVNDQEADQATMTNFFETLKNVQVVSLASKNPENQSGFGVQESEAILLTFIHDKKITDFFIGNTGNSTNNFYIKTRDSNNIYLVNSSLRSLLTQDLEAWQKKAESTS